MKKRVFSAILVVIMLIGLALPVNAAFDAKSRESVCVIKVLFETTDGGEYLFGGGSGFFVGTNGKDPQYLVTNYHVIKYYVDFDNGKLTTARNKVTDTVYQGRAKIRAYFSNDNFTEAYPVEFNDTKDIAVLKLEEPTSLRKPLPLKEPEDNMAGSDVYAVGYPGLSENTWAAPTKSKDITDASVTKGSFSRLFTTQGTGVQNIEVDCDIKHGNSGGPLLNDNNEVIGIAYAGYNSFNLNTLESEKMSYAVSISEVIPVLKKNDIDFETSAAVDTPKSKTAKTTPAQTSTSSDSSFPIILIVIIVAVVLVLGAGAAVAIVLVKSSKKNKEVVDAANRAAAQRNVKNPSVRSLAAQHRGMKVPLAGQIIIGRSQADCALVFKEGTPGVSGRHCSLAFDPASGDFLLTDLRSSYGTFLQNGTKLTAGVPYRLKAGDRFYLGDPANLIAVELE